MASLQWKEKVQALNQRRREWATKIAVEEPQSVVHPVARYDETSGEPAKSFNEYLLPTEINLLRTMNLESFERNELHSEIFHDAMELATFMQEQNSSTSNDEDGPPASEELFFDEDTIETVNRCLTTDSIHKPLTSSEKVLLRMLAKCVIEPTDSLSEAENKKRRRLITVRLHCKQMKRKRYARAYQRYTKTRAKKLELAPEAITLQNREIEDKNLEREFYFGPGESPECTALLAVRRAAIVKKFEAYRSDADYRQMHRNRIFFNVNKRVPEDESLQPVSREQSQKHTSFVMAPNEAGNANDSIGIRALHAMNQASSEDGPFESTMTDAMAMANQFNEKLNTTMASLKEYCDTALENAKKTNKTLGRSANASRAKETSGRLKRNNAKNSRQQKDGQLQRETVYMESRNAWTPSDEPNGSAYLEQRRKRVQRTVGDKQRGPAATASSGAMFQSWLQKDDSNKDPVQRHKRSEEQFEDPKWDDNFDKTMFDVFRRLAFEHYQKESGYEIANRLYQLKYKQ